MNEPQWDGERYIEVQPDEVSPAALRGIIEAYVLREGTDYGSSEFTLEEKVQHVEKQIVAREVLIVYNPTLESVDILTRAQASKRQNEMRESSEKAADT